MSGAGRRDMLAPHDRHPHDLTVHISIPGGEELRLQHVVLDVNGTLSDRGQAIAAAFEPLRTLGQRLELHVLSADTFGTAEQLAQAIDATYRRIRTGSDKRDYVTALGAAGCVAVGNGRNDALMLQTAALGIVVIGPEGAHREALAAADVAAASIEQALALLLEPTALAATLRR
jgi:soluble P-type ATPase